jgi:PAS domain S-box-containing protein
MCQFLGNGLQAVLAAAIILRFSDRPYQFNSLRSMTVFIVGGAFVAPAIASVIPAYVYLRMGWASAYWSAWGLRTLINVVTTLTLVPPLVLILGDTRSVLTSVTFARAGEFTVLMVGLFAVDVLTFVGGHTEYLGFLPALCAPLPLLIWAAVRFGPGGLSVSLLGVAWISITTALDGHSPLAGATPVQTAVAVQLFIGIWALPLMLMSALFEETRDARETLVANQERLAIAQEAGKVAAFEWFPVERRSVWSRELEGLYGFQPGGFDGTDEAWLNRIHPDDRGRVEEERRRTLATGTESIEFRVVWPDGALRWLYARGRAHHGPDGAPDRVVGVNVDITEQKRTEDALRQSEAEKEAIIRAMPDLMFVQSTDAQHRYLDYYAQNRHRLLVSPGRFLGKPMREVLPTELAESFELLFKQAVESGEPGTIEYSLPIRGEDRSYEARVVARDDDRLLSIVRDITDRKRIEEAVQVSRQRYALATAAGGVGVWDWSLETNQIYVDPQLKGLLGFEDWEIENTLDEWGRRVHPDDAELVMSRAREHIEGRTPSFDVEHRMIHKDGSIRWFLARGSLVSSDHERPNRIIGTDTDITARKRAETALQAAQQELTQMSRATALGELAASIAHEVDQPLAAIVVNAAACLRWVDDGSLRSGEVREALAGIVDDANRASTVIARTRELFRHGSHETVSVELNGTIMEVLALTRSVVQREGVSVRLELAQGELLVMGDRVQLQQVLLNLIVNGMDAMRQVTGGDRVLFLRSWSEQGFACVAVRDTGHGFDPGDVERLFDPFYSTKPQGMGIGLAVSRSIVRAHGGRLLATLNEDNGATFQFRIPAAAEQDG